MVEDALIGRTGSDSGGVTKSFVSGTGYLREEKMALS